MNAVARLSRPKPAVGCSQVKPTQAYSQSVEEADIAVLSPGSNHAFQREFGEFVLMRIRISGHDVCILPEAPTPFNSPQIELGFSHAIPYDVASCCLPNGRRVNGSST